MHKGGWKPFWAALGAALLVLLPLVGGTVLLTRQMLRQQWLMQTAEPQRGVPIDLPKADDRMTLLLCTAGEQPGFVLFYLNAPQNAAHLLAVPGQLTVPFGGGEASLAQCYAAAGPARCRQALLETLALPEDTLYLALSPAVLETLAARYGAVRVSLSGALTAEELDAIGQCPDFPRTGGIGSSDRAGRRRPFTAQPPGRSPRRRVGRLFPPELRAAALHPAGGPAQPEFRPADRLCSPGLHPAG